MLDVSLDMLRGRKGEHPAVPDSRIPDVSDIGADLAKHFRDNYPILLDGALPSPGDQRFFVRQARESLTNDGSGPRLMPSAILRETLETIVSIPRPTTGAGLTAVAPGQARVWWDESVLDNLDNVLASLDKPRPILRFYDVTGLDPEAGRWHENFDVDIALHEHGKSVELLKPERVYIVELGYLYADGRLLRLARTNTADIPREGRGAEGAYESVRSVIRPRRAAGRKLVPAAADREWVDARPDHAARDAEAELLMHMLYRAFLLEGPRVLRTAKRPVRRSSEVLESEYAERGSARKRKASPRRIKKAAPAFLVARLDAGGKIPASSSSAYLPVPVRSWMETATDAFRVCLGAIACARLGNEIAPSRVAEAGILSALAGVLRTEIKREDPPKLVSVVRSDVDLPHAAMARPVFDAARDLHRRLAGMDSPVLPVTRGLPAEEKRETGKRPTLRHSNFGGSEGRRLAKAGVRVTRMALTLEGRMRPGAKLRIGGKLVYADADGCFSLECVLTGRRASIPLSARTSTDGEVRSVINVDWDKRPAREKKKV